MDTHIEEVRGRVVTQLRSDPDVDSWDQASKDRLLLLQEYTRTVRLKGRCLPTSNGKLRPIEYSGESCVYCGSINMRRCGTCSVCENCGETGGCS